MVEKARYSDPKATDYMTQTLIKRRDKVVAAYINQVCPVVDPTLASDGTLRSPTRPWTPTRLRRPPSTRSSGSPSTTPRIRRAMWERRPRATATSGQAPPELLKGGDYVGVRISATHPQQPRWSSPATFIFRRTASGWEPVGAER